MVSRNASVEENRRIVFRVGINIGDIIIDGDDIFGDGVNVAARLQTLCEPGGLCISRGANEQIRDKDSPRMTLRHYLRKSCRGRGWAPEAVSRGPEGSVLLPATEACERPRRNEWAPAKPSIAALPQDPLRLNWRQEAPLQRPPKIVM